VAMVDSPGHAGTGFGFAAHFSPSHSLMPPFLHSLNLLQTMHDFCHRRGRRLRKKGGPSKGPPNVGSVYLLLGCHAVADKANHSKTKEYPNHEPFIHELYRAV
jgi:hypothetical protein